MEKLHDPLVGFKVKTMRSGRGQEERGGREEGKEKEEIGEMKGG